jgi:hypothetical protein
MKKICLLLITAALATIAPAQINYLPGNSISPNIFSSPLPGSIRYRYNFILPHNNRMVIDLYKTNYANQLPNIDSLFKKIWVDLQPMRDSLSDPLKVRKVDYMMTMNGVVIGIKQYNPTASYFSYKDDELVQMKIDQDTLRYIGFVEEPQPWSGNRNRQFAPGYTITLLLNNLSEVEKLPVGILASGIELLKKDIDATNKGESKRYSGTYDLLQQKRITSLNQGELHWNKKGWIPYVQMSAQYGRGEWIPSAGAGLEYFYGKSKYGQYGVRLLWEPYFFFSRDLNKKLVTERNDFVSLKFYSNWQFVVKYLANDQYNLNFSIGYLIRRKGDWFEPNTFKFSLPGLQRKNLLVEPEFFFNKFFRHFSPSLKLVLFLE